MHAIDYLETFAVHDGIVATDVYNVPDLDLAMMGIIQPQGHGAFMFQQEIILLALDGHDR